MDYNFLNKTDAQWLVISPADLEELAARLHEKIKAEVKEEMEAESNSFLTRDEACKMLGKTPATLWRWDKVGYLKPVRVGTRVMYHKGEVSKILNGKQG